MAINVAHSRVTGATTHIKAYSNLARRKPILLGGLGLSMFTFAMIAWGENITAEFSAVAELFQYLAGTAVLIVLVLLMPPYRKSDWLSGLLSREQR